MKNFWEIQKCFIQTWLIYSWLNKWNSLSCSLKLLTKLRLGLSHLNKHGFKHSFKNCISPFCTCSLEVESTKHFFPALPLSFSTPYFFLKWFKQHFTTICTISWRCVCQSTTLWKSNFWWKWQWRNTWNLDKVYSKLKVKGISC